MTSGGQSVFSDMRPSARPADVQDRLRLAGAEL